MKRIPNRLAALLLAVFSLSVGSAVTRCVDVRTLPGSAVPTAASATGSEDPLGQFETERQQLRARQRAQLNDIIHDDATDAETLMLAQRRLLDSMGEETAEENLQGSLRARGFEGAVVSVSGGGVNVFVRSEGLTRQQSAVILQEAMRETGKTGGNVKIIPINSPKVFAQ